MSHRKKDKAARAMEHLDDELILSAMVATDLGEERPKWIEGRRRTMKNNQWKKWAAVAAAFVLVLSIGLIAAPMTVGAIIALDVNPSIEIDINKKEEIREVRTLNEEAEIVIGTMDLIDVDLEVGINAIIGSMLKHGYLSTEQNSILISIDSKDQAKANALKEKLTGEIDALLGGSNIDASVITQDFEKNKSNDKKADENKISPAKAALISKIVAAELPDANGVPYTYEVLAQLKVNELKLILESKSLTVDGIEASGTASGARYIQAEAALAIALEHAGVAEAEVRYSEIQMDYDDDIRAMVYEIEFYTETTEYEYEIHATDQTVIEKEAEPIDQGKDKNDIKDKDKDTFITRKEALEIACKAAGISVNEARDIEIELERRGGIPMYEIEFETKNGEYEYLVDAKTGEVEEKEVWKQSHKDK